MGEQKDKRLSKGIFYYLTMSFRSVKDRCASQSSFRTGTDLHL